MPAVGTAKAMQYAALLVDDACYDSPAALADVDLDALMCALQSRS